MIDNLMDKQALIEIGLSGNEAEIYLALLNLGPSLVSKIVKKTGINRTNIYDRVERLIDKGLVSYIIKNNRKYFCAAEPKRILRFLEEKKDKIEEEEKLINQLLPELEKIKPDLKNETVEVFEGKEGLKTILENIIESKQNILTYGSDGNFSKILKFYFAHYLKILEKSKISMRVIFNHDDTKKPSEWKLRFAEVKYIPKEYKSPTETTIYGDNVVIFILTEEPRAILIKSKATAESYKNYFNLLWKIARKQI
jgi:sugar-specific transcriptional regulator TrmB